jgi:hypothetical protein
VKITTRVIEHQEVDDTAFEGCSEAPKGCDRCCDRSGEAGLADGSARGVVSSLKDLLLSS